MPIFGAPRSWTILPNGRSKLGKCCSQRLMPQYSPPCSIRKRVSSPRTSAVTTSPTPGERGPASRRISTTLLMGNPWRSMCSTAASRIILSSADRRNRAESGKNSSATSSTSLRVMLPSTHWARSSLEKRVIRHEVRGERYSRIIVFALGYRGESGRLEASTNSIGLASSRRHFSASAIGFQVGNFSAFGGGFQ